jgi:ankyrin repeat protein
VSAGAGHHDVINYLQMKGARLDVIDKRGDTALFWAARNGHAHIVRYLCDEGVNVNGRNKVRIDKYTHFSIQMLNLHISYQIV